MQLNSFVFFLYHKIRVVTSTLVFPVKVLIARILVGKGLGIMLFDL